MSSLHLHPDVVSVRTAEPDSGEEIAVVSVWGLHALRCISNVPWLLFFCRNLHRSAGLQPFQVDARLWDVIRFGL